MSVRLLRTLLLVAALLGLAGQAAAVAAAPLAPHGSQAASPMTDECMEMMADSGDQDPRSLPCDGTYKCMLAMGCVSQSLTVGFADSAGRERTRAAQEYWPAVAVLRGASFAPEPDPPTAFD